MKQYTITQNQLEQIEHSKRRFEHNAELVHDLCSSEKDDVAYGFELGRPAHRYNKEPQRGGSPDYYSSMLEVNAQHRWLVGGFL